MAGNSRSFRVEAVSIEWTNPNAYYYLRPLVRDLQMMDTKCKEYLHAVTNEGNLIDHEIMQTLGTKSGFTHLADSVT